jgi:hypothetical protein
VPAPTAPVPSGDKGTPAGKSRHIPWTELRKRAFGFELVRQKCKPPLRLIALIENEDIAKKIVTAMRLPAAIPELHPARPQPQESGGAAMTG